VIISRYICLFFVYSVLGWVYESIFCTIKLGKWSNRGFLFGPACPIYGCGAVAISLIMKALPPMSAGHGWQDVLRIFLISMFGSMILEYVTSWLLEVLFHASWWDYSDMPLNLNGRISLFTSMGFGAAGPIVIYYIVPPFEQGMDMLPALLVEFLSLVAVAVTVSDLTLTVAALTDFERRVSEAEAEFNGRMDALVEDVQRSMNKAHQSAVRRVKNFKYPRLSVGHLAEIRDALQKSARGPRS
jgi:uncharacterized membrane protein